LTIPKQTPYSRNIAEKLHMELTDLEEENDRLHD